MTTSDYLRELREKAGRATPGPWTATQHAHAWQVDALMDAIVTTQFCYAKETDGNARYIAACSPKIIAALAEVAQTTATEEAAVVEFLGARGFGDAELTKRRYAREDKLAALRRLDEAVKGLGR